MELRSNCRYAIIAPTSMGVRLTPANRQPVHISREFTLQSTSAESNVLNVAASLGMKTKVLTNFVQDSPVASFIKADLRFRNIDYEGPDVPQGGPWGCRHQFNLADAGFGVRGARVWNDRAGEVGRLLRAEDFDLARIFDRDGAQILHLSGLIAALSPGTGKFCLDVARAARRAGTRISFDLNYRASFWQGREQELRGVFQELASMADILIGNEEDFQLALGIEGPEAGGRGLERKISGFEGMIGRVQEAYPNASAFAATLREVVSADRNLWGAILLAEDGWHVEQPREISVLDRIGGGDGFVARSSVRHPARVGA
jgi:2-dehydro-3-deoxygluconokinase